MAIIILKKPTFTVYIKLSFLEKLAFLFKEIKESLLGEKVTPMLEQAEQDLQQKIEELVEIQKTIQKIIHSQKRNNFK